MYYGICASREFKNLAKLRGKTAEIQDYDFTFNPPDLQTFTSCIRNKSKSCESQAQSPSHRLTGTSEQTFSQESTQKRATVCSRSEILELLVVQCTLVRNGICALVKCNAF